MEKEKWFKKSKKELEDLLKVDVNKGLSEMDVVRKKSEYGENVLNEQKKTSILAMFSINLKTLW